MRNPFKKKPKSYIYQIYGYDVGDETYANPDREFVEMVSNDNGSVLILWREEDGMKVPDA